MNSAEEMKNTNGATVGAEEPERVDTATSEGSSLRAVVVRGGLLLSLRQAFSVVISVLGFFILARIVGPAEYGRYTTAFAINAFVAGTAQTGIGVFLIRSRRDPDNHVFDVAATFLVVAGCVAMLIEIFVIPRAGTLIGLGQAMPILVALACALPINLLTVPVQARFERRLDYARIAIIQLISQMSFYLVALPLAATGHGAWSLAVGLIFQQILECAAYHIMAHWLPRPAWDWHALKDMLGYSAGFSAASLLWAARGLVNPLIVGALLGVEAVAFVALAIRIVDMLNFVKNATWQLSIAVLSRIQEQPEKLLRALNDGMVLQVLALGPPLLVFLVIGRPIVALALGQRWLPVFDLYPFVAASMLANTLFSMHAFLLYMFRRNWAAASCNAINVGVLAAAAWVLLPRYGIVGYGYAELFTVPTSVFVDLLIRRQLGSPSYAMAFSWLVPLGAAILLYQYAWWTICVAFVPLLSRRNRDALYDYVRLLRPSVLPG